MARGIALRMLAAKQPVRVIGRDGTRTRELVEFLGPGAEGRYFGDPIGGKIVFLAVPYQEAWKVVAEYGDGLAGKIVVDISNPVEVSTFERLTTEPGTSAAEELAELLRDRAEVVKAFNTVFPKTLETGTVAGVPVDVFIAGDSEKAKTEISALVTASGLRAIDVGPLRRARELETMMLLIMRLQVNHRHFDWDTALKILP